ncbi:hypothetical protein C8Q73DRAFT_795499 [Cubamyces lactineus]|nr:hypothetical protein C8Q73DRAFT_795499 [Cubamyces lactineus]
MAAVTYFKHTSLVSHLLATMFQAAFPERYTKYAAAAFAAGVWIPEDPWLSRVIVYKLDSELHYNQGDGSPTAIFPVGQYRGGTLAIPQLRARLENSVHCLR